MHYDLARYPQTLTKKLALPRNPRWPLEESITGGQSGDRRIVGTELTTTALL